MLRVPISSRLVGVIPCAAASPCALASSISERFLNLCSVTPEKSLTLKGFASCLLKSPSCVLPPTGTKFGSNTVPLGLVMLNGAEAVCACDAIAPVCIDVVF